MKTYFKESAPLNVERIIEGVHEISRYHRIQGSKELLKAVEYLKEELDSAGVKNELIEGTYDGKSSFLTLKSPTPWELISGEVAIDGESLSTSGTPLLVLPGSPPGETEGEILAIESEKKTGKKPKEG